MGVCRFCGRDAGMMRSAHGACETEIRDALVSYFQGRTDLAALTAAGIAVDPALIVPGLFTYRSGLAAAERLLDLPERPTAIFASNDDMAAATVAAAQRRGIDVPRQLTVCGFDDTALATTIWPELTTVRQPISDMSCAAMKMLMTAISSSNGDEMAERHETVDFTLIPRETTAQLQ